MSHESVVYPQHPSLPSPPPQPTKALVSLDYIQWSSIQGAVPSTYGAPIQHDGGAVEACHGKNSPWHVLVTAWPGEAAAVQQYNISVQHMIPGGS